jgi:hypothetical protein
MRPYQRRFPHRVTIGGKVVDFRDLGKSAGGGRKAMAVVENPAHDEELAPALRVVVKAYGRWADKLESYVDQHVLVEGALSFDRFGQLEAVVENLTQLQGEANGNDRGAQTPAA